MPRDVKRLSSRLIRPNQTLVLTKYFTARIVNSGDKERRQKTYLEALAPLEGVEVVFGNYLTHDIPCRSCGATVEGGARLGENSPPLKARSGPMIDQGCNS